MNVYQLQPPIQRPRVHILISDREREVLHLIANECNDRDISRKLFITHNTVRTHRKNLLKKLGAKNGAGLVRRGFEMGMFGN